jgi:hypothetical protein
VHAVGAENPEIFALCVRRPHQKHAMSLERRLEKGQGLFIMFFREGDALIRGMQRIWKDFCAIVARGVFRYFLLGCCKYGRYHAETGIFFSFFLDMCSFLC